MSTCGFNTVMKVYRSCYLHLLGTCLLVLIQVRLYISLALVGTCYFISIFVTNFCIFGRHVLFYFDYCFKVKIEIYLKRYNSTICHRIIENNYLFSWLIPCLLCVSNIISSPWGYCTTI